jgi:hypothetical protein
MKSFEKIICAIVMVAFFLIVSETIGQTELPQKPDMNVTYISQRPLYPGYWLGYPDDIPTFWVADKNSPDGSRKVTKEEYAKLVKHKPAQGDEIYGAYPQ